MLRPNGGTVGVFLGMLSKCDRTSGQFPSMLSALCLPVDERHGSTRMRQQTARSSSGPTYTNFLDVLGPCAFHNDLCPALAEIKHFFETVIRIMRY